MFMLQHITESLGAFHGDTTELVNRKVTQSVLLLWGNVAGVRMRV